MADTLFGEPVVATTTIDPDKDYFAELVGPDKRYKETRDAGRALVEKDAHISRIEAENAAMREEISKRKGVAELIDQIETRRNTRPAEPDNQEVIPERPQPQTQPKVEDIVEAALSKHTRVSQEKSNLARVVEVLRANFGPGYAAVAAEKAQELGVGPQTLETLAKEQPKAVFRLLGVEENPRPTPNAAPAARANPGTLNGGGRKNFAFYEDLRRKTDPRVFYGKYSAEMITAAETQGDDFYR